MVRGRRPECGLMLKRALLFFCLTCLPLAAEEPNHADHEELRALLRGVQTAMNEQKYQDLKPYFHDHLRVTTINQDVITKPEALEPYFRDWIGPGKYVKGLKMELTADDLTEFYGEGDSRFGVVRGGGVEDYDLTDGRRLDMRTRWTATVVKQGGKWKILALHIGANFYKNPIVDQFQKAAGYYGVGGFAAGSLLGVVLTLALVRRGQRSA